MHVRNHVHGNKSRCIYILQLLDNCLTLSQLVIVSSLLLFNVLIVMQKNFPKNFPKPSPSPQNFQSKHHQIKL